MDNLEMNDVALLKTAEAQKVMNSLTKNRQGNYLAKDEIKTLKELLDWLEI